MEGLTLSGTSVHQHNPKTCLPSVGKSLSILCRPRRFPTPCAVSKSFCALRFQGVFPLRAFEPFLLSAFSHVQAFSTPCVLHSNGCCISTPCATHPIMRFHPAGALGMGGLSDYPRFLVLTPELCDMIRTWSGPPPDHHHHPHFTHLSRAARDLR